MKQSIIKPILSPDLEFVLLDLYVHYHPHLSRLVCRLDSYRSVASYVLVFVSTLVLLSRGMVPLCHFLVSLSSNLNQPDLHLLTFHPPPTTHCQPHASRDVTSKLRIRLRLGPRRRRSFPPYSPHNFHGRGRGGIKTKTESSSQDYS